MKLPLSLSKRDNPEVLSASRAELISRIWQAIAFIEELRGDLKIARATDPVGVVLTEATQRLVVAAGFLGPKAAPPPAQQVLDDLPEGQRERRNAAG